MDVASFQRSQWCILCALSTEALSVCRRDISNLEEDLCASHAAHVDLQLMIQNLQDQLVTLHSQTEPKNVVAMKEEALERLQNEMRELAERRSMEARQIKACAASFGKRHCSSAQTSLCIGPRILYVQMNAEAEREMLESQLERAGKENIELRKRLHIAVVLY